jgi:hypothetical protein
MPPMGLLGCSASFQRLMAKSMEKIDNIILYIDDLLICSQMHELHLATIDVVMKINLSKCFFENTEVSRLGLRLMPNSIKPGKYYLEHLWGRRFILYTDKKPRRHWEPCIQR